MLKVSIKKACTADLFSARTNHVICSLYTNMVENSAGEILENLKDMVDNTEGEVLENLKKVNDSLYRVVHAAGS